MTKKEEETLKRLFDRTLKIYTDFDECGPVIWTIRNSTVTINNR